MKEVAAYLGISESIVRRLVRERRIPFVRVERRILFVLPAVRRWLDEKMVVPEPGAPDSSRTHAREISNRVWDKVQGK